MRLLSGVGKLPVVCSNVPPHSVHGRTLGVTCARTRGTRPECERDVEDGRAEEKMQAFCRK